MKKPTKRNPQHRTALLWALCTLFTLTLTACLDDDDAQKPYPSLITELVEVNTNGRKQVSTIVSDDGTIYMPTKTYGYSVADTTFRALCAYEPLAGQSINVYQLQAIPAPKPLPPSSFNALTKDPINIISVWNSPRYINVYFSYLTTHAAVHAVGFCEDSITVSDDGLRTAHISLLHSRPGEDAESYSEKTYICLPTYVYKDRCDSVALTITTYRDEQTFGCRLPFDPKNNEMK